MLSHLVLFGWMAITTSGSVMRSGRSVVMTRVERVCSGSDQCLPFSSCPTLQGRNKQDTLQTIRQLQCGFSGSSPMVCCPPSLPRKAVEGGGNPAVNVDVNSRTNLDIGGLNARTGNFPLSQEETTLWSEEFGPKWNLCRIVLNIFSKRLGTRTVFSQDDKGLNLESRQKLQKLLCSFVSAILIFTLC